jgi:histidinol dehydrogenase
MKIWHSGEEKGERYLQRLESRYARLFPAQVDEKARRAVAAVASQGDKALVAYVRRLDLKGRPTAELRLRGTVAGGEEVGEEFVTSVELALANLKAFHELQAPKNFTLESDGGDLGIRVRPIESVGVYVAAGSPVCLVSLLTTVVAARIAGVSRIAVATPPRAFLGSAQLRYLLDRLDLREIYLMGGAHAVAALAYGTDSVAPVDKIVGAGGRLVAAAKRAVSGVVGVDAAADPYEMVIVADAHAEPEIVAADLLAAAGLDEDALAVLLTPSKSLAAKVERRVSARVGKLPKKSPARAALRNWGAIILVPNLEAAADVVNRIAPQRVELLLAEPLRVQDAIDRVGMVVVGAWSPSAIADLVLGASQALPAMGAARFASPLGVGDFVRRTVVARVAAHRYPALARAAAALAPPEGSALHDESLHAGSLGKM